MSLITSVEKTVSKVWKHWWLLRFEGATQNANTPQQSFGIQFVFVRGTKDAETGVWELSPFSDDVKIVQCADVFAFAAEQAALETPNLQPAQLLEGLLGLAVGMGRATGALD